MLRLRNALDCDLDVVGAATAVGSIRAACNRGPVHCGACRSFTSGEFEKLVPLLALAWWVFDRCPSCHKHRCMHHLG
ncbi:MAG: hypothetical protein ACKN82_02465, partial [Pirellula sp.]